MTGGHVVVLGPAGRNFGAGMSGGKAYVLDQSGGFSARVNLQMVDIEALDAPEEIERVHSMIERHHQFTGSVRARHVLDNWQSMLPSFVCIMPKDFKRAVASLARAHEQGLSGDEAIMVAFEENARDLARVAGN
jgi:glutamate synthase (ferredoxin)